MKIGDYVKFTSSPYENYAPNGSLGEIMEISSNGNLFQIRPFDAQWNERYAKTTLSCYEGEFVVLSTEECFKIRMES